MVKIKSVFYRVCSFSIIICMLVTFSLIFSFAAVDNYKTHEVWYRTFTVSADNYNSYETEHFQFLWGNGGDSARVTTTFLEGNAKILEDCWNIYMGELNMTPPTRSVTSNSDTTDYKVNVVIMGTGIPNYESGWAYAGLDDAGYPYLMCCVDSMQYSPETWVTPHEFGHAVHMAQGNNSWGGNELLGPWYEAVGNWFREQYLGSDKYTAKQYYSTDLSHLYLRACNLTACNGRAYYEAWPILQYLTENPDGLAGYGNDFVHKMLSLGTSSDTLYTVIDRLNPNVTLADTLGYYASHMATFDLNGKKNYYDKINSLAEAKEFYWQQYYTILEYIGNNTYIVPDERAPQAAGFNVVPLEAKFEDGENTKKINITLNGLNDEADAQWRARIVIEKPDGTTEYSSLFGTDQTISVVVNKDDELYLSIAACTAAESIGRFSIASWNNYSSEAAISFSDKTKYIYSVTLENAGIKSREINIDGVSGKIHSNGGGFVADTANVAATVYVGENAKILGYATVSGNAVIDGHAVVQGNAKVSGNAIIDGYAIVDKNAQVTDNAYVSDYAIISGTSTISGHAKVIDSAYVTNYYLATDYAVIKGQAICCGASSNNKGSAIGQAIVYGDFFDDATIATMSEGAFAGYQCITASDNFKNGYATNNGSSYVRICYDGLFTGYTFDSNNGSVLLDSYEATHATTIGEPSYSSLLNGKDGIITFDGESQYAILDSSMLYFDDSMQIDFSTLWRGGESNQKAFYLGGETGYLYFTPSGNSGYPQIVICDGEKEYTVTASKAFPQNNWVDVTITFYSGKVILTIDGESYGTSICSISLFDIAQTGNNECFLAKGRYYSYYNGSFDYFNQYYKNIKNISFSSYTEAGQQVEVGTSDDDSYEVKEPSVTIKCNSEVSLGDTIDIEAVTENIRGGVYCCYILKDGKIHYESLKSATKFFSYMPVKKGQYTIAIYCDYKGKEFGDKVKITIK